MDERGNIRVYKKFWTDEKWDARKLAPPLLAYADLMLTNDPRCTEAANMIYNEHLKHELE